jgi:hypothetical protein
MVRLALDDDGGLIADREFFENFLGRVCSHKSFRASSLLSNFGCLFYTGDSYDPVTCTACGRVHLINPKTGKVLETAKK